MRVEADRKGSMTILMGINGWTGIDFANTTSKMEIYRTLQSPDYWKDCLD